MSRMQTVKPKQIVIPIRTRSQSAINLLGSTSLEKLPEAPCVRTPKSAMKTPSKLPYSSASYAKTPKSVAFAKSTDVIIIPRTPKCLVNKETHTSAINIE